MTHPTDIVVWRAFEKSAVARALERGARAIAASAAHSRAIASGRSWLAALAPMPGQVLLSAAVTHLALMVVVARPVSWQWMILPSIAAVMGLVLIACSSRARMEP